MELERHEHCHMPPEIPSLPLAPAVYPHIHEASKPRMQGGKSNGMSGGGSDSNGMELQKVPSFELAKVRKPVRYRECLKNHAAGLGGHAVDGCGEFMPSGEEGTLEALKCAACDCHRNFHRREVEGEKNHHTKIRFGHLQLQAPNAPPLALPAPLPRAPMSMALGGGGGRSESDQEQEGDGVLMAPPLMSPPHRSSCSLLRKRFRTRFTAEQKERMRELSEKLGWRIQKHDEQAVQQFCAEVGVKRHVLKVWMHNNKNTLGRKPACLSDQAILQFSPPTAISS